MAEIKINRESLRWLTLEGIAIVVSILLAFSIQAWWEDRQDRARQEEILTSLLGDLRNLEQAISAQVIYISAISKSTLKLLEASAQTDLALTEEMTDHLLNDFIWFVDPSDISAPILDSLAGSGDLSRISDNVIRREVTGLLVTLSDYRGYAQTQAEYYVFYLMPYLQENFSLLQLWNLQAPMPGNPGQIFRFEPIPLDKTTSHRDMLKDAVFQNILLWRHSVLDELVTGLQPLANRVTDLRTLIEEKLGGS